MTGLSAQRSGQNPKIHGVHARLRRFLLTRFSVGRFFRTLEVGYTLGIDIGVVRLDTEAIPGGWQHIVELLIGNLEAFQLAITAAARGSVLNILSNSGAGVEVVPWEGTRNKEVLQILVEHTHGQGAHWSEIPFQRRVKLGGLHGCQRHVTPAADPMNRRYGGNIAGFIDRRVRIYLFRLVLTNVLDLNLTRTNYGLVTH